MRPAINFNLEITDDNDMGLPERIREFKNNKKNMEDLDLFVDDVLREAEKKAQLKMLESQKSVRHSLVLRIEIA